MSLRSPPERRTDGRRGCFETSCGSGSFVSRSMARPLSGWRTTGETHGDTDLPGGVLRCRETVGGVALTLQDARPAPAAWPSSGWLLLRHRGRGPTRELSGVTIDGDAVAVDVRGDPRDPGPTTPWWRARPQELVLQGPRSRDDTRWEILFAAAAPSRDDSGPSRGTNEVPHLRLEPRSETVGATQTRTSGVVLNRFRLPAVGGPPSKDAVTLRIDRDVSFPAAPLRPGATRSTLLGLSSQALREAAAARDRGATRRHPQPRPQRAAVQPVGCLSATSTRAEVVVSARLRARDPSLTVLLREITLTPTLDPDDDDGRHAVASRRDAASRTTHCPRHRRQPGHRPRHRHRPRAGA